MVTALPHTKEPRTRGCAKAAPMESRGGHVGCLHSPFRPVLGCSEVCSSPQRGSGAALGAPRWAGCQQMALQNAQTRGDAQMPPEMASPALLSSSGLAAPHSTSRPKHSPCFVLGCASSRPETFPKLETRITLLNSSEWMKIPQNREHRPRRNQQPGQREGTDPMESSGGSSGGVGADVGGCKESRSGTDTVQGCMQRFKVACCERENSLPTCAKDISRALIL